VRTLRAQGGVVAVARVDDGVVAVGIEQPAGHVAQQLLETAFLPSFSDATGEPGVAGDR
jgi:hypothetical protein